MNKISVILLILISVIYLQPSALAAAEEKSAENAAGEAVESLPASGDAPVSLPRRMASFAITSVCGLPVAIARRTYHQTRAGSKDLIGDSKNPLLIASTTILSLPFAIMGGPIEGIGYALHNGWQGSGEEPFGKKAFSLQKD